MELANDSTFGLQAAIFTTDIGKALKAVHTLDYGGVLVNEVPTWRADQQPYGGLRDSGNTREGPAYSVKEMTEIRWSSSAHDALGSVRRLEPHLPERAAAGVRRARPRRRRRAEPDAATTSRRTPTMLARDDIDAVYNPLPNHLHAEWSHRALDAGKHVLCEKPLTLSPADSAALFDHAESAGLTILEAYMWPHHPRARALLDLVADGSLGMLRFGRSSFSYPMDMSTGDHRIDTRGAGALFDIGIYCIAPFMLIADREPVGWPRPQRATSSASTSR